VAISHPNGEIAETDIDRVLEAAGAVSMPSTRSIIHVLPRSFTVDGEGSIKDPVGMIGVRLEVDTHIISANLVSVKNIQRVLESEGGAQISSFVFSGLASSLAVLSDTEKELGVVCVDLGAGVTNICVFVEGTLAYSSVIPIGARHITNDLAIGLRISLESAEKIKIYLSQKLAKKKKGTDTEEGDEIDLSSLGLNEELKKVSQKTLVEGIIRPRLNEIFTMVGLELKKSGFATQTPAGIVITGGGAKTVGIEDSAKRMLSMPVRVGMPNNITGLIDDVENPSFATAIGLLMYGRDLPGAAQKEDLIGNVLGGFSLSSFSNLSSITSSLKKLFKKFIP
jgi:cell division protein FtsA